MKAQARRTQATLATLTELTSEQLQSLPVIQAIGPSDVTLERFEREQRESILAAVRRSLFLRGAVTPVVEWLGLVGVALAIGAGARAVASDPSLAVKLLSFLTAALLMYRPAKLLSAAFGQVASARRGPRAARRGASTRPVPHRGKARSRPFVQVLTLRDVVADYGGAPVLRGVSLEIPAGRRVALVGASGAGKSTLFSVLLGFVQPREGAVTWDRSPLEGLSPTSLRAQLAWVPQEPLLFSGTVRENLALGAPRVPDDPALWEALRQAHAADFVRALPDNSTLGSASAGSGLSGGQRQRLAVARAFLRSRPCCSSTSRRALSTQSRKRRSRRASSKLTREDHAHHRSPARDGARGRYHLRARRRGGRRAGHPRRARARGAGATTYSTAQTASVRGEPSVHDTPATS